MQLVLLTQGTSSLYIQVGGPGIQTSTVGMYGQRLYSHVSLISYPYGDSSAPPYLGTAILTILCFRQTEEQELVTFYCNCSTPRVIPTSTKLASN